MQKKVKDLVENIKDRLVDLNQYMYDNPELGYEEVKASKAHADLLEEEGFKVERNYLDIATSFRGEYDSKKPGPTIGYLAEYDALPGIGHGCGHNILGTASTGAGIVLSKLVDEIGGKVVVLGTPAEETSGAKVEMADKGAFDDLDIALIAHGSKTFKESGSSAAMDAIEFSFKGKNAHAAGEPEKGINALDACILTFTNINALREHVVSSSRIHGVIIDGGKAANIVPDTAVAQFYVRSPDKVYLQELTKKVINCAKAGALAAGAELEYRNFEASYDNMVTNEKLQEVFTKNLKLNGVENIAKGVTSGGSTDMGNVSQVCPSIHPYFAICEEGTELIGHSVEFADASVSEVAIENMLKTINALVLTAVDVILDAELLKDIKEEFKATVKRA